MDPIALYGRALDVFGDRLAAVGDDQWAAPTPCSEWDVRTLVNHVVGETFWAAPLLAGRRTEEVTGLDGDVIGDDPVSAFQAASAEAKAAFAQPGAAEATVHASFGSFPGSEYAWQLTFDTLIHAWDLAAATGGGTDLPDDLVIAVTGWVDGTEALLREAGAIGEPLPTPPGADPQTRLLARLGRSAAASPAGPNPS